MEGREPPPLDASKAEPVPDCVGFPTEPPSGSYTLAEVTDENLLLVGEDGSTYWFLFPHPLLSNLFIPRQTVTVEIVVQGTMRSHVIRDEGGRGVRVDFDLFGAWPGACAPEAAEGASMFFDSP